MSAVEFRRHARALRNLTSSWKPPLVVRALSAGTKSASLRQPSSSCLQCLCVPKVPSLLVVLQNQSIVQDLEIFGLDGRQFVDGRSIPTETAKLRVRILRAISRTAVLLN